MSPCDTLSMANEKMKILVRENLHPSTMLSENLIYLGWVLQINIQNGHKVLYETRFVFCILSPEDTKLVSKYMIWNENSFEILYLRVFSIFRRLQIHVCVTNGGSI